LFDDGRHEGAALFGACPSQRGAIGYTSPRKRSTLMAVCRAFRSSCVTTDGTNGSSSPSWTILSNSHQNGRCCRESPIDQDPNHVCKSRSSHTRHKPHNGRYSRKKHVFLGVKLGPRHPTLAVTWCVIAMLRAPCFHTDIRVPSGTFELADSTVKLLRGMANLNVAQCNPENALPNNAASPFPGDRTQP
jgi:hypothetical protein